MNLSKALSVISAANASAAGTATITSAAIDTAGYEGVLIAIKFGAIVSGAVVTVKAQQSSDNAVADAYADLLGTSQTVADTDDNKVFLIDIYKPAERYLKAIVSTATQNSTVECIVAYRYGAKKLPAVDDSTTVGGSETHISPIEGTA